MRTGAKRSREMASGMFPMVNHVGSSVILAIVTLQSSGVKTRWEENSELRKRGREGYNYS